MCELKTCLNCRNAWMQAERAELRALRQLRRSKMADAERIKANQKIKQSRENWLKKKPAEEIAEILEGYRQSSRASSMVSRAASMNAPKIEKFTTEEIIERDGLMCYLCQKILTRGQVTLDHLMPLSRGGEHTKENVKIACRSCNSSKGAKTLEEFLEK